MAQNIIFSVDIGWQALLKDLGVQPGHVLRRAGLPDDLLSRGRRGLPTEDCFHFWNALEAEAGDVMFPLHLVETLSAESFDPPLFTALCSDNFMQAVKRLAGCRCRPTCRTRCKWPRSHFSCGWPDSRPASPSRRCGWRFRNFRLLPMPGVTRASSAPPYNRGRIRASHSRPFLTVNEGMWRLFEPDLRRRLSELDATTTAERVRAVLLELLPDNEATIERTAGHLGLSKRTLQRRLEDEGENFRALVNSTRESLARHYLGNTTMSGAEIAFLLGFEDPNSFYRAFQDWTGQTPHSARHSMRLN